jgi:hypothetical protein
MISTATIDLAAERYRRDREYRIKLAAELEAVSARCGDYAIAEAAAQLRAELEAASHG